MLVLAIRSTAFRFAAGLVLAALTFGPAASSAELVMVERAGCPYCLRWDAEVAPAYPKTAEGKVAPLRRHDLGLGQPADIALQRPVRYTPTFLLVDEGREVARITGYVDNAMFWGTLSQMVAQLPRHDSRTKNAPSPTASPEQP